MSEKIENKVRKTLISSLTEFIEKGETSPENYLLGVEMEFFIVKNSSGEAVTYFEDKGINYILKKLVDTGWREVEKEDGYITCLARGENRINLEPGGQLEFSFAPADSLSEVKETFFSYCRDILPIVEKHDYSLISLGYQPVSRISSLPLLPKKRYEHMYNHFEKRGALAHNMMKGTASLQVSLDFSDEKDFADKFAAAAWLVPIIYALFDNAPFFEGEPTRSWSIRSQIWQQCDSDRCGLPPGVLERGYSYEDYAAYIADMPAIFDPIDHSRYTGDATFAEISKNRELCSELLDHMLTMSFTDIRAKRYIEIRMADALPFQCSLGYIALLKGLLYFQRNLDRIAGLARNISPSALRECLAGLPHQGIYITYSGGKTLKEWGDDLFNMAERGLAGGEIKYLNYLREFFNAYKPPRRAADIKLDEFRKERRNSLSFLNYSNINQLLQGRI